MCQKGIITIIVQTVKNTIDTGSDSYIIIAINIVYIDRFS